MGVLGNVVPDLTSLDSNDGTSNKSSPVPGDYIPLEETSFTILVSGTLSIGH